jgi:amidase
MSVVASGALALAYMPAHEQLRLFRAKQLSPVETLRAQITQIESIGASINAVTYSHLEEALIAAQESEARYHCGNPRPLDGITVAVKDEYDKGGWIVTAGSVLLRDSVKHENHPVVDKLLEAGVVLNLQTAAPEFYLVAVTWSDLWGVTRNPWNLDCTPGGSSGGSAAVLGAGMATLASGRGRCHCRRGSFHLQQTMPDCARLSRRDCSQQPSALTWSTSVPRLRR